MSSCEVPLGLPHAYNAYRLFGLLSFLQATLSSSTFVLDADSSFTFGKKVMSKYFLISLWDSLLCDNFTGY